MKVESPNKHLMIGLILFLVTTVIGVAGYRIAGWPILDSLYMVIITIFGVGYGEVIEMTNSVRIFTMVFIVLGCTSLIYTVGAFINWLTEGQLKQLLGRQRMEKEINQLKNHTVICGYGRVGRLLSTRLSAAGKPFIIIDSNAAENESILDSGYLHIDGDATEETTLRKAGIERAEVLATVIPNDAVNVFIVLSCRALNPKLHIIARANQVTSEAKLKQAGTDRVVMPAFIGAERIAHLILRPNAQQVLEEDLRSNAFLEGLNEIGLDIHEFFVDQDSPLIGKTLEALETRGKSAFIVIAVRRKAQSTVIKPPLNLTLSQGDTLIVMCHEGKILDFAKDVQSPKAIRYRGAVG